MKKVYEKPMLMVEEFDLTQTIATGCTTISGDYIGQLMTSGCEKNQGGLYNEQSYLSGAHVKAVAPITDTNGDGKISQSEWNAAVNAVREEFKNSGVGHLDHTQDHVFIGGVDISTIIGLFSS